MTPARSPWQPPADVPPERLFRRLLCRPRPWAALDYRYPARPDIALHVRALTPYETACAMDVITPEGLPPSVASESAMAGVVAAALWEPGGPVFSSPEQASRMPQREWLRLVDASLRALYGVMPSRSFCNERQWGEWTRVLETGARHPTNLSEMVRIHACCDVVVGFAGRAFLRRPDRYFGLPVADITEGQILAFDAAFNVAESFRQKATK